jgi:hypothetical protein
MSEYDNKVKSLKADNREDEAILYKVRLNICDIFCKMAEAADRKVTAMKLSEEEDQTRTFNREYLEWFEKIPANWKTNLELARKHNDVIIVSTEEIKLETAELLRGRFLDYAGGEILLKK